MPLRLGVDIGGVIIGRVNDGTDTSFFGDNYLATTAVPGAIDALSELNIHSRFAGGIDLVSKCGPKTQRRTTEWLDRNDFHALTLIGPDRVHFTPTRLGKAAIATSLGLTHHVDDRAEVLEHMLGTTENLYLLNPDPAELEQHSHILGQISLVDNWQQLVGLLR